MLFAALSAIFIISPLMAIILGAAVSWDCQGHDRRALVFFCICMSVFLGLLNTTKEMDSDIEQYYHIFIDAGNYGLAGYLAYYGQEPFYYFISWISFHIFGGNWKLFITVLTCAEYLLLCSTIGVFANKFRLGGRETLTALIFMFLYFQLFSISSQLIRQMLAASMALKFLADFHLKGKKRWWLGILAMMTHTTIIPVAVIGILPMNKGRFKVRNLFILLTSLLALAVLFIKVVPVIAERFPLPVVSMVSYFNSRLDDSLLLDDFGRAGKFNAASIVFLIILSVCISVIIFRQYFRISLVRMDSGKGMKYFLKKSRVKHECLMHRANFPLYLSLLLIFFVTACSFMESYYLAQRFFFYLYPLSAVILLQLIPGSIFLKKDMFKLLLIAGIIVYFFAYLSTGVFKYEPIPEILTKPLFMYFL